MTEPRAPIRIVGRLEVGHRDEFVAQEAGQVVQPTA
jgi:hypothetical protein